MAVDPTRSADLVEIYSARTALFVPGDRPDRFGKAAASGTDLVVCDLEDAVAPGSKAEALEAVTGWLAGGARACVRLNVSGTAEHVSELSRLKGLSGLVAVLVPKAEDPAQLERIHEHVGVPVVPLIETALGVARVMEVAAAGGVARLGFGHLDYSVDIGSGTGRVAMLHARSAVVLASRVAGLPGPFDGVTPDLDDDAKVADDAAYARDLGFTGKLLIHPRQVAPARETFTPSTEQVAWARRVVAASEQGGAVRVDGAMVDAPVVARAVRVLRQSRGA